MKNKNSSTTKEFQQTVKQRRAAFGFTQRVLAKKLGCKASHVAYLENGRRRPSLGLLLRLAKVLGVRPATLALRAIPELAGFGVK